MGDFAEVSKCELLLLLQDVLLFKVRNDSVDVFLATDVGLNPNGLLHLGLGQDVVEDLADVAFDPVRFGLCEDLLHKFTSFRSLRH